MTITRNRAILVATISVFLASLAQVSAQQPRQQRPTGTNVAVVDINQVFQQHNRFKSRMDDLKKQIEDFEASIRAARKQITTQGEKAKDFKPGSVDYKRAEQTLAKSSADLQVNMQLKRKEFLEQEAKIYYEAYNEVSDHVQQIAGNYGIGLVLRFSRDEMDPTKRDSVLQGVNRAVVYHHGNLDITRQVIDRLNRGLAPKNVGARPFTGGPQKSR